ncbi:MAG: hypothetical protein KTR29_00350 [Rhodothermaceae bacterium]|nr:hypothetical protein [Rhodothermaceae bacterium]
MWLGFAGQQVLWGQVSAAEVIEEISNAYERVDFEVAEQRIKGALDRYEDFSPNELAQIYVFSALIHYVKDDQAGAEAQLAYAFQLNPGLELDPILSPPGFVEIGDRLKKAIEESGEAATKQPEVRYLVLSDPRPGAAMRSMILPGWGQLYKGDRTKGYRVLGAWTLTAGSTLAAHLIRNKAENDYLDAVSSEEALSLYDDFNRWHQIRNNLFLASAGIWVYSYIDALIYQTPPENRRISLYTAPGASGPYMQLTVKF